MSTRDVPFSAPRLGAIGLGVLVGGFVLGGAIVGLTNSICTGLFSIGCAALMFIVAVVVVSFSSLLAGGLALMGYRRASDARSKVLCGVVVALAAVSLLSTVLWPLVSKDPPQQPNPPQQSP